MVSTVEFSFVSKASCCFVSPETSHKNLETHIHALEAHELELKEAKRDLEAQLESVVIELQKSQEMLSDQEIELNKSKLHSSTLKNKYEV